MTRSTAVGFTHRKALISRPSLTPSLLIGCLLILALTAAHARVSEAKQHGSAEDTPPGVAALMVCITNPASAEVAVGNPGNGAASLNEGHIPGIESVAYGHRIAKHEVTDAKDTELLNKVDAAGTNLNAVYNTNMGSDARGGISSDAGKSEDATTSSLTLRARGESSSSRRSATRRWFDSHSAMTCSYRCSLSSVPCWPR